MVQISKNNINLCLEAIGDKVRMVIETRVVLVAIVVEVVIIVVTIEVLVVMRYEQLK